MRIDSKIQSFAAPKPVASSLLDDYPLKLIVHLKPIILDGGDALGSECCGP